MSSIKRVEDPNLAKFWETELEKGTDEWYAKALAFWNKQASSDDGVLCGFGNLSSNDISGSRAFLKQVTQRSPLLRRIVDKRRNDSSELRWIVVDCGCGIGRVSTQLLSKHFDKIDLLEPAEHLLRTAETSLGDYANNTYPIGLQDFKPAPQIYYLVWMQWILSYLTDDHLIEALVRMKSAMKPGGVLIAKENISSSSLIKDDEDSSVTRTDRHFKRLFRQTGLKLLYEEYQKNWPNSLYRVKTYALTC